MKAVAVLALALALSAGAPARAEGKRRLAILPAIIAGKGGESTPSALYGAIAEELRLRPALEAIAYDELLGEGDEPVARAVEQCGSDAGCIAARLDRAGIALGLRIAINFDIEPPLASMVLVDAGARRSLGEAVAEIAQNEDPLHRARALAAQLLDKAGFPLGGRIIAVLSPADAEVTLEGGIAPDRGAARAFTVPAGRYTLRAHREGYRDAQAIAVVTPGAEVEVALALEGEASAGLTGSPWFWVALGALAAGGTAAILVAAHPSSSKVGCLCLSVAGGDCRCD